MRTESNYSCVAVSIRALILILKVLVDALKRTDFVPYIFFNCRRACAVERCCLAEKFLVALLFMLLLVKVERLARLVWQNIWLLISSDRLVADEHCIIYWRVAYWMLWIIWVVLVPQLGEFLQAFTSLILHLFFIATPTLPVLLTSRLEVHLVLLGPPKQKIWLLTIALAPPARFLRLITGGVLSTTVSTPAPAGIYK